jgi:CspA family cold shock protein
MMTTLPKTAVCQRCGRGFVVISSYRDLLERRGIKVKVPVTCATCFRKDGPLPKSRGKVKWYSGRKHYGFITTEEGRDVFLHQEQIISDESLEPQPGQIIRFHVKAAPKGPEALNAELAAFPPEPAMSASHE